MVYKRGYSDKDAPKPASNEQFVVVRQSTADGFGEKAVNVNFIVAVTRTGQDEFRIELLGTDGFTCSRQDCRDLLRAVGLDGAAAT